MPTSLLQRDNARKIEIGSGGEHGEPLCPAAARPPGELTMLQADALVRLAFDHSVRHFKRRGTYDLDSSLRTSMSVIGVSKPSHGKSALRFEIKSGESHAHH